MIKENNYKWVFFLPKNKRIYRFEDVEILHDFMLEQQEHSPELQFRGEGLMNCGYNCLCMPVATGLDCPSYERIGEIIMYMKYNLAAKTLNNTCRTVS